MRNAGFVLSVVWLCAGLNAWGGETPSPVGPGRPADPRRDPTEADPRYRDLLRGGNAGNPSQVVVRTAPGGGPDRPDPIQGPMLSKADLRDLPLSDACRLLSEQTGLNLVPSAEAGSVRVTIFVQDVSTMAVVEALCKAHQLWFQRDPKTGIVRISTVKEYRHDLGTFQEEKTEFFTLFYPNALDVGNAVRNLYDERVVLRQADADEDVERDLSHRLSRFDLMDARTQGFGRDLDGSASGTGFRAPRLENGAIRAGSLAPSGSRGGSGVYSLPPESRSNPSPERPAPEVTADEIARLERAPEGAKGEEGTRAALLEALARRQQVPIYVTVARRQNKVIVRTADEPALEQIRTLVRRMDVPSSLVLLEVRILSVDLLDGNSSFFEYQWTDGNLAGGFSTGNILKPSPPPLGPAGTGLKTGNFIFQYVDSHFAARVQALQQKNRLKVLATPLLLTANNEVSRLFVGREVPLNRTFTGGQTLVNQSTTTTSPGSTVIEFRPVGTLLLMTPNINADRTVTLRIVQESSDVNSNATVLVPSGSGFASQTLDIVSTESLSGTIVAKSELAVAFGGLVEKSRRRETDQVPILGDIPVLGFLFRREVERDTRREIVVVVRPYVLQTPAEAEFYGHRLLDDLEADPESHPARVLPGAPSRPAGPGGTSGSVPFRIHGLDSGAP